MVVLKSVKDFPKNLASLIHGLLIQIWESGMNKLMAHNIFKGSCGVGVDKDCLGLVNTQAIILVSIGSSSIAVAILPAFAINLNTSNLMEFHRLNETMIYIHTDAHIAPMISCWNVDIVR